MIKFNDLKKNNDRFQEEFKIAFGSFLNSGWYILGKQVDKFEKEFAAYCGTKYCIGVGNGLDAIALILKGYKELGKLNDGDEIIVPANTYIATILAIIEAGLKPILVEPNIESYNISIEEIKQNITKKTKGIMAVHLYGRLADMEIINKIAKENNLLVFEDAAQAHGATSQNNLKAGNLSDAGAFSFYPTKNLGALGDGGAITTSDKDLYNCIRSIANYGSIIKDQNDIKGTNSRLDEIQAAFLSIKLKKLDDDNLMRISFAKKYLKLIDNSKFTLPCLNENPIDNIFHIFPIRCKTRDDLAMYLKEHRIQTGIHYPTPPHKQKAFTEWNHLSYPTTEKIHSEIISIPLNPTLKTSEIETIINVLNKY